MIITDKAETDNGGQRIYKSYALNTSAKHPFIDLESIPLLVTSSHQCVLCECVRLFHRSDRQIKLDMKLKMSERNNNYLITERGLH